MGWYYQLMRKLIYNKRYRADQTQQIGPDDDAETPLGAIKRRMRAILQHDRADLSPAEIERRLNRMMQRGMRRT